MGVKKSDYIQEGVVAQDYADIMNQDGEDLMDVASGSKTQATNALDDLLGGGSS